MVTSGIRRPPSVWNRVASSTSWIASIRSVGVRQGGLLERLGVRQRHLGRRDPAHRRVEVVEGALLNGGGDLGADAVAEPVLFEDHRAAGLRTEAQIVSRSSGRRLRRSTTSTQMPSLLERCATSSATTAMRE